MSNLTKYSSKTVNNVEVFYREAGDPSLPVILLLHGFPTSSYQFRNLIPRLADQFRVIAPDLPGFGSTKSPASFEYTFDNLADTIDAFIEALGLERFTVYMFDYGAPIGFRIALQHPERITALITQNGNAYEEGLTDGWNPLRAYWQDDSVQNRDALRMLLARETTEWQYLEGAPENRKALIGPDPINHDQAILDRNPEIQLDLFGDYQNNVSAYPDWQAYLREHQPPTLAIWGRNDPFFAPAGAEAFKRDVPGAVVELLDAGHFPLETHVAEIAASIRRFLGESLGQRAA